MSDILLCFISLNTKLGITFEPTKDKTYNKRATSEDRSACASAQSDQSSLIACASYSLRAIQRVDENPCRTGLMGGCAG